MISICVAAWNSLEYLKILHKSIIRNTKLKHELLVHDNGSSDGVLEWLKKKNIEFTHSDDNLGFCGVNNVIKKAKYDYVFTVNCDMYLAPGWDIALFKQIQAFKKQNVDRFTISLCMIEPFGSNPEYTIANLGHDHDTFREEEFLSFFLANQQNIAKQNTIQWSHPILIPKFMMEEVDCWDEDYFPGWTSDYQMPVDLYKKGCRNFIMLGDARNYHFISKTFKKLPQNIQNMHGRDIFLRKNGIDTETFRQKFSVAQPFRPLEDGLL